MQIRLHVLEDAVAGTANDQRNTQSDHVNPGRSSSHSQVQITVVLSFQYVKKPLSECRARGVWGGRQIFVLKIASCPLSHLLDDVIMVIEILKKHDLTESALEVHMNHPCKSCMGTIQS